MHPGAICGAKTAIESPPFTQGAFVEGLFYIQEPTLQVSPHLYLL